MVMIRLEAAGCQVSHLPKKLQKNPKKVLTKGGGGGIILRHPGSHERMTLREPTKPIEKLKTLQKKCLTNERLSGKIKRSSAERRTTHRTLKIEQYRKTCNGTLLRADLETHVKQFQKQSNSYRTQAIAC